MKRALLLAVMVGFVAITVRLARSEDPAPAADPVGVISESRPSFPVVVRLSRRQPNDHGSVANRSSLPLGLGTCSDFPDRLWRPLPPQPVTCADFGDKLGS